MSMTSKKMQTMDGNEAAAHVSYAFTEIAAIYPITPSSPMAELVDRWSALGRENLFGQRVQLVEMQSEHGAAAAMHGALETGALATSYTASQGLLLMVPAMYRMAGQLWPGVLHVSARTVGTHAFSIFGDHSDVMSCRQTGFAMLATGSVQEVMDLAGVAHLAAIEGSVPFLHFFDGFRTSHELQKIEVLPYEVLGGMLNQEALEAFRKRSLNPERPVQRSTVQNPDVFFQAREAATPYYDRLPAIVESYMQRISQATGREYGLFNYHGSPDAEHVIVAMGSVSDPVRELVDYLTAQGEKVGFVQVHLYRPFSVAHFAAALPQSATRLTVLDRTKEPGAAGDPLYLDICAAMHEMQRPAQVQILSGRYGLSSKDVTPAQIQAVFDNMKADAPRTHFTVGINDDVTHRSLPVGEAIDVKDKDIISCKFWGLGSDGTVGANKNSIKIIGDNTPMYAQAYFEYDTKKSGGITRSHLRFGHSPIRSAYLVSNADFVACHQTSYLDKYDMLGDLKNGGVFLLNCPWQDAELEAQLPAAVKRALAEKKARFYTIDATALASGIGLGNRANTVLQAAFFKLAEVLPLEEAVGYMKEAINKTYKAKGTKVCSMNCDAVDLGVSGVTEISVPESWLTAQDTAKAPAKTTKNDKAALPSYIREILEPVNALKGDYLPVSAFAGMADGTTPAGTSKYEKRGTATAVPQWQAASCIQCNQCAYVCPHACIRPFLLTEQEKAAAPQGFEALPGKGKALAGLSLRIQVDPLDCTGCGCCVEICPAKEKALVMRPLDSQMGQMEYWEYALSLPAKKNPMDKFSVKGSQFEQPLLEFSGACAGCGETPYMKLMTQLFGERMIIANATGCTQAWGAACPNVPYTVNTRGHGPAFSNSLFENNAEFSLGMCLSMRHQRARMRSHVKRLEKATKDAALQKALSEWLANFDENEDSVERADAVTAALTTGKDAQTPDGAYVLANREHLSRKSMWMYGGDGWAYDIGYGGLDHVLASGEDVNILIVDTEVYSNTGGQSSKATPLGAVAQFAAAGKKVAKKNLGLLAAQYGTVYVAQVAMGADQSHLIKVLREAESFRGPSVIIAYAPCIAHGIVEGMAFAQEEAKLAVKSGYWHLYRFDPRRKEAGENPFVLDSKDPVVPLRDFLKREVRFTSLARTFPDRAEELMTMAERSAAELMNTYKKMSAS
ncbi:pyruvate:ferredoxin (flavodoxin) oxidoreductase [Desulfovibrio sp. OttesenSCG-928-G15]|nr:pyruvate:ferredoxin (flavodoxin) oxidoreductase [Desulfovibrio sp. OttesenSCG-928-G15]